MTSRNAIHDLDHEEEDPTFVFFHDFMRQGPDFRRPVRALTKEEEETLDWDALVSRQPRLEELSTICASLGEVATSWEWCMNLWSAILRNALASLVGWYVESNDPYLRSSAAYDIAYKHCLGKLTRFVE